MGFMFEAEQNSGILASNIISPRLIVLNCITETPIHIIGGMFLK